MITPVENGGPPRAAALRSAGLPDPPDDAAVPDALPPGSPWWLPILGLWPTVTPGSYAAVALSFAGEDAVPWPTFETWLTDSGLAEPVPDSRPHALLVRSPWLPILDRALDALLESEDVRAPLLTLGDGPRQRIITRVARWARAAGRWTVLRDIWLLVSEDAANLPAELLPTLADLPVEARKEEPILTWASAVAEADAAPVSRRADAMFGRLLLDAASVHADWALRADTDVAVLAGTLRMIGERRLPSSGGPLETSWRTKSEIDRLIDERSRLGRPPGRLALSFFRAMSARLALFRADFRGAVEEARWAAITSESASISALAEGVEALARSLAGEVRDQPLVDPQRAPERFRFGGLSQIAAVLRTLAEGRQALQVLDRAGVERALADTRQDTAAVAGVWAIRVALGAFHAALWGDATQGMNQLFAELSDQSLGGQERDEPMGELFLGRARELLLSTMGAYGAAAQCADSLPESVRAISQARSRLWAGQLGASVRIVERALPDPNLVHPERLQLLVMGGAATQLEGSSSAETRSRTVRAFADLLRTRNFLAIATLPSRAREAVFDLCAGLADDPEAGASFALLRDRLGTESRAAAGGSGFFRLTEREAVLLPLLATSASVPEIARHLHLSVHTVRKQVATLREKFQAPTRAELVRKAGIRGALR